MSASDYVKKLDEVHARFSSCPGRSQKFRLGLEWVDLLLEGGRYFEASEAAGLIQSLASDRLEQARACQRAGRAYLRLYDYDKASYFLKESLERLGDQPEPLDLSRVYHDLAWMQYRQGYLERARGHAENAELALESSPHKGRLNLMGRAECHHLFSLIESACGDYQAAVERLEKEIAIRQEIGDEQLLAASYNKLASVLQTKGEILRALKQLEKALELAERTGNIFRRSISLKNLGEIKYNIGDLDAAWRCHTDSLAMSVQAGNHLGFVFNHAGLGRVYRSRGAMVSAMAEYNQALDAAKRLRFHDRESSILVDIADLLCDQERWAEAQMRLDGARVLDNEREQDPSPWHLLVSARAVIETDRQDEAVRAVQTLEAMLDQPIVIDDEEFISIPELRIRAAALLRIIDLKRGEREKAEKRLSLARKLLEVISQDFSHEQKRMFLSRPEFKGLMESD